MKPLVLALCLCLPAAPSLAQETDPFAKSANESKRSMIDIVPAVPGSFPAPDPDAVREELTTTPATDLNLRCQGFLTALGQASNVRRQVTGLLDTEKAIDRLQTALINEAVAAAGEGYSVKERLALAKRTAMGFVPKAREQVTRFVGLLRKPSEADAQTLANQKAVCDAVLRAVKD